MLVIRISQAGLPHYTSAKKVFVNLSCSNLRERRSIQIPSSVLPDPFAPRRLLPGSHPLPIVSPAPEHSSHPWPLDLARAPREFAKGSIRRRIIVPALSLERHRCGRHGISTANNPVF